MGCDIHTFIEYSDFDDQDGQPYWQCFGGRINAGRNYRMFGVLAGVRDDSHQLFSPRGLPEGKLSYSVQDYMRVRIVSDEEHQQTGEGITLTTAKSWTEGHYGETIIDDHKGNPAWVTNPDLHSHSWLTLAELRQAMTHYMVGEQAQAIEEHVSEENRDVATQALAALQGSDAWPLAAEWHAIVAAMETFEAKGCKTRLIFCFDN